MGLLKRPQERHALPVRSKFTPGFNRRRQGKHPYSWGGDVRSPLGNKMSEIIVLNASLQHPAKQNARRAIAFKGLIQGEYHNVSSIEGRREKTT